MTLEGSWVRYGAEASAGLVSSIAQAKSGEPLAPVTVIVPSNQVGVSARRELASGRLGPICGAGPGLIGVSFLTPYRLADLLGAALLAESGRRPVSTPVLTAAVRAVLRDEPGLFKAVASHPATEATLVAAYRELRDLSPGSLKALANQGHRAGEVTRVVSSARARLEAGWYDEEDLISAAASVVASGKSAVDDLGTVIVYLPQRLSRHSALLLGEVAEQVPTRVLAGTTGIATADADVVTAVERLGATSALGSPPDASVLSAVVSTDRTRIITASDADDEVRAVVRVVADAVRRGTPLDRIAVLHASADPYARLLREHLNVAGIAVNGTADVALTARTAGRALLGALELPLGNFRRHDVMSWLSGAPILHDGRPVRTASWERLSREAAVVGGISEWDQLLANLADRLDAEADGHEADDGSEPWRADRARSEARRARELRSFVLGLADGLATEAATAKPWSERVAWAKALLEELLGGTTRRSRWPDVERRAAERIELALDRLTTLDSVEGPVDLAVFTRTLLGELETDLGRIGRFGEGVLVGPVSMGVGLHLDLVVMVGLAEGSFPSTFRDDSLLPDAERRATNGELSLRGGHVERLHHRFIAALSGAGSQVITVPRGDLRRSSERVPSRWVLDVASTLAGTRWWGTDLYATSHECAWVEQIPSFEAALRAMTQPATNLEHRLRTLMSLAPERGGLASTAASIDPTFAAGVATLDARQSSALTRFDGNLAELVMPAVAVTVEQLAARTEAALPVISATRLERWARCPFAFFMSDVLRVQQVEDPETQLRITPLEQGSLVHEILERFVMAVLDRPEAKRPRPRDSWTPADHLEIQRIGTEVCTSYENRGVTGRPIFWRQTKAKLLADLTTFLTEDDARRATLGAVPLAAELAFGMRDGQSAVEFPLPDGRLVRIRGKADRVDIGEDGSLIVVDYKTGRADQFKTLKEHDPHMNGTKLQLAVYGLAARAFHDDHTAAVRASYWFTSAKGRFQQIGYPVTDEVLTSVSEAIATIVSGIEAGMFAAHPREHTTSPWVDCIYCEPDGLGTSELRRQWIRKLKDPALSDYVALAGIDDPTTDGSEPSTTPAGGA